jgi:hypothetical protein
LNKVGLYDIRLGGEIAICTTIFPHSIKKQSILE